MNPDDLILVSVDDHIAEPATMFDAHVPEKYKEYAPRVVLEESGREQWYYGTRRGRNLGLNAVAGKPPEMYNIDASRYDEMRPGCYDPVERVRDMNAGGQLAGLNFPNFTGFSGQVLNQGPDAEINDIMIKAYNDWHIDEWCATAPERFIPCGILPLFDIERAVAEVKRLAGKGCHSVTFSENPEALKMPSIHSKEWYPLFEACVEHDVVLSCHLGSSSRGTLTTADAPAGVAMTLSPTMTIYTLVEMLWAAFWNDFPTLKVALTEGDIGWIPYFLWRSEHVRDRHDGWATHDWSKTGGPTELFKRNFLVCFIKEANVFTNLLDWFNVDNVCWESDYPHSDSTWPDAPEELTKTLNGLSDELINKFSHENALSHYHFDPFAIRPKEKCTISALRAESPDVDVITHVGRQADERDTQLWNEMRSRSGQIVR